MDIGLVCWECSLSGQEIKLTIGEFKDHNDRFHIHYVDKCSSCPLRFSYPGEIEGHLIDVENHLKTQCLQCHSSGLEKFMDEEEFKSHNFEEHSKCKSKCEYCPYVFPSDRICEGHMVAWHDHPVVAAKLQCIHCKLFELPKDLEKHNKAVHRNYHYKCTKCVNVFYSSGDCERHACQAKEPKRDPDGEEDVETYGDMF